MTVRIFPLQKKAQMFTIISLLLIGLMFLSFEIFSQINAKNSINTRISTMNSFLHSIEENLERQMFIVGFRIIFLAEDKITKDRVYISDIDGFFQEGFFNGSVAGTPNDILTGVTYDDLIDSIKNKGDKINVDITIDNSTISVSQDDPWNVKFTLEADFLMKDKGNLAQWQKRLVVSAFIPITDFEDPVYSKNSNFRVSRKIQKTIYDGSFVSGGNYANLSSHFNNGFYANNTDAPNFLMRLEGDLSSDVNGVETFVDTLELSSQGLNIDDTKSVVDHIYFDSSDSTIGSVVSGMPSYFKIDSGHKSRYQIP